MSLLLVQGYGSDNDERILTERREALQDSSSEDEGGENEQGEGASGRVAQQPNGQARPLQPRRKASMPTQQQRGPKVGKTGLPSASFAFDEVSDIPDFLRPAALVSSPALSQAAASVAGITGAHTSAPPRISGESTTTTSLDFAGRGGAGGGDSRSSDADARDGVHDAAAGAANGKRAPKEDAASLSRLCEGCQVPKTFSSARGGMVCPLCGDKPRKEGINASQEAKKREKGGTKDKEKLKRMKGQSSHATWKTETEMELRQTYD